MLRVPSPLPPELEALVTRIVDAGYTVHNILGPGFKESIYEKAFCRELELRGLRFECQKKIAVEYKGLKIHGQKIDLIIEDKVLVELKAVPRLRALHKRQVVSYMKTMNLPIGLVMNFNTSLFKSGVKRVLPYRPKD